MSENHREPEVPEAEVPAVERLDGFARITLKELAITHVVKSGTFGPRTVLWCLGSLPTRPLIATLHYFERHGTSWMEILTVQEREIVQEIPEIQVVGRSLEMEWRMVMARFNALGPYPRGLATVALSSLVFIDLCPFLSTCQS